MAGGPERVSDASIVVDGSGLLTIRVGDAPEPRADGLTNAEAMAVLGRLCAELGRPIVVATTFPGGHVLRQELDGDGTMRDLPDRPSEPRAVVVAAPLRRPAPGDAASDPVAPAVESVSESSASGPTRSRRRLSAIAIAAAAAAVVALVGVNLRAGPEEADAAVSDTSRHNAVIERAWWPLAVPMVTPSPTTATPTVTPTPTATVTPTPSPTPSPTVPSDPPRPRQDTQPPTTPGGIGVSARTATTLTVSWGAASDDVGVTGYEVFLNGGRVATTGATTADVSGLVTATTYTVAVRAVDAAGNASGMASASASTVDVVAPAAPGGLAIAGRSGTTLTVSWRAASDNVAVTSYVVYLNGRRVSTTGGTSATVKGLTPATSYTLSVAAVDAAGNVSERSSVEGTTPDSIPPSRPAQVTADARISDATIGWSRATDNVFVTGYIIYLNGRQVARTGLLSTYLEDLEPGTEYTVSVAAVDSAGNVSARKSTTFGTMGLP